MDNGRGTWARDSSATFEWFMDGVKLQGETSYSITIPARNYVPGTHTLTVVLTGNNEQYSKTLIFKITQ